MKREIFSLIRGVSMASVEYSLNPEEKGSCGVTLSLQVKTFPTLQSVTCCSQTSLWVRERGEYSWMREWVEWLRLVRFLSWLHLHWLPQLSPTRLTFTAEMKWQPRPAASVLSGLIRSEAFNANLLWSFHLYHSLCPEYNCICSQWYCQAPSPNP